MARRREGGGPKAPPALPMPATPRIALKCQHTIFATASQRGKTTVFENPGPLIFLMPVLRASSDAGPSRADARASFETRVAVVNCEDYSEFLICVEIDERASVLLADESLHREDA